MKVATKRFSVIGLPTNCLDYDSAMAQAKAFIHRGAPSAIAFANTHIAVAARKDRKFGAAMDAFDLVLPDGMPLVWCLNRQGAGLKDRVYGPLFMEKMLASTPKPWKHFLFGGTAQCLEALQSNIRRRFPDVAVAGASSPPFRSWTEDDLASFAAVIRAAEPDFVWVALGGVRQETWIAENMHRFQNGVFLAVGDAFELLAGRSRMAPMWMQRAGLGWLFRLCHEPRRLWKRYLVYNTLFIGAILRASLTPRQESAKDQR
jgi:N-acetylglucosaminyldiphosphoundecaprenol N-acetyl-beta-D-mannosaminyltransferase